VTRFIPPCEHPHTKRCALLLAAIVDGGALDELEEVGVEPTPEAIRDRVYDRVEVRAEFSTSREEPLVDRVVKSVASS